MSGIKVTHVYDDETGELDYTIYTGPGSLDRIIRRAEDEGKEVSVLQEQEDMGSPCLARDKEILHGMRVVSLVRAGRDNEKGGGAEMESAAELHIEALVEDELERIVAKHGLFASDHEAWAII